MRAETRRGGGAAAIRMREIVISRFGPPSVLRVRERHDPQPGPGEIRVRVAAAGINFADLYSRMGLYPDMPPLPAVPGFEVAGRVDAVGSGVTSFATGERVIAVTKFGGYTDALVVPAARALRLPARMSMEEGAALPVAYLTAYHAMCVIGNLRAGERVLIHSAAGGVGTAAIQLAKMIGAEIFGTTGSAKLSDVRRLGVDHAIASDGDVEREVRRLTAGRGVHLILDPLGSRSWKTGYRLLAPTGRLCILGASEIANNRRRRSVPTALLALIKAPRWHPLRLMWDNRGIFGIRLLGLWDEESLLQHEMNAVLAMCEAGGLRPVIDRTFPLTSAADAHSHIHDRRNVGKVLLSP